MENERRETTIKIIITVGLMILGAITEHFLSGLSGFMTYVSAALYIAAYIVIGAETLIEAVKGIAKGELLDENFLMAVASLGAMALGDFLEANAVLLFYSIGELFEDYAEDKSRDSIAELMDIRPDYANLYDPELQSSREADPYDVKIGDFIQINPGEKVPLDGIVIKGASSVQTAALTGESVPRDIGEGEEILSGYINMTGVLLVEVKKEFDQSTAAKIMDLVENAASAKAKTEKFITRFARIYTPAVCFVALCLALIPPLAMGQSFSTWVYRALIFLVISCPCALVISVPLSFFGGLGAASRAGILVKGSNYLEALGRVDTVVFDKTGTLTTGNFKVTEIIPERSSGEKAYLREEVLELAAYGECYSSHPIGVSIKEAYDQVYRERHAGDLVDYRGIIGEENGSVNGSLIRDVEDLAGYGIKATFSKSDELLGDYPGLKDAKLKVAVGNLKLMKLIGEEVYDMAVNATESSGAFGTIVYVAVDGEYAGLIAIGDELKPDVPELISTLQKDVGIFAVAMLTGDRKIAADTIASEAGIKPEYVFSEMLPDEKLTKLEKLIKHGGFRKGSVIYVGDGINDAPVLARADVGVAMGGVGSDAAIEAADVVIMTDEPGKLLKLIAIARKTVRIAKVNIAFALFVKLAIMILGALGLAGMWAAVFADVGVAVLAILNSMRTLR